MSNHGSKHIIREKRTAPTSGSGLRSQYEELISKAVTNIKDNPEMIGRFAERLLELTDSWIVNQVTEAGQAVFDGLDKQFDKWLDSELAGQSNEAVSGLNPVGTKNIQLSLSGWAPTTCSPIGMF